MQQTMMYPTQKKKFEMPGSTLKIIAIITMLIDHVGAGLLGRILNSEGIVDALEKGQQLSAADMRLFSLYSFMRMVGRVAFPIFCFLLIEGFEKTRNRKKYAMRLGIFALISEIPFDMCFNGKVLELGYQNVFFTLFFGMITMIVCRMIEEELEAGWKRSIVCIVATVSGMILATLCKTDYSWIGVLCIMMLYFTRNNKVRQTIAGCLCFLWELTAPIAFIPIHFYNGKRGLSLKYVFYLFYPLHLLVIYGICMALGIADAPAF